MVEREEKIIPWLIILIICTMFFFGSGIILKEVMAENQTQTLTVDDNATPTVGTVILNGGSDINLTENATVTVQATATITDTNGFEDINSVIGYIYSIDNGRAATDDNYCYYDSICETSSCSGDACTATCEYEVWFHATPTDSVTDYWEAYIAAVDDGSASSSATSAGEEMNTLTALDVTSSDPGGIAYGSLAPGADTTTLHQTTTVTNTGNISIENYVYGDDMATGSETIAIGQQEYSTSSGISYGSGVDATSTVTNLVNLDLAKPTASSTAITDDIYWGLAIPSGQAAGVYTGTNTFVATPSN